MILITVHKKDGDIPLPIAIFRVLFCPPSGGREISTRQPTSAPLRSGWVSPSFRRA
jgi:hypothetical protein